jgi:PST family polysaccharide transporter
MDPHLKSASIMNIDYFNTDHLMGGLKTRALKQATITVGVQFSIFICQMIGTIILARLLTPHDYGLVTMAVTVGMLLGNFGVNGFTEAIIQAKELNHKQVSTLFWINVAISIVLCLAFIAFSFIFVWFFKEPSLNNIIIAIALSNVLSGLSVQHLALMKRNIQYSKISINELIATIIGNAIPIILAVQGWGY